ncbi:WXG100 family type VII secretion target [Arthrobacter sp. NA-172]|uniref:WXG100 family type VII secretion target n=1 Tax=Arthrobacter sp. NA-172 TaxID=3367524 RepID=UPI00375414EE
MADVRVDGGALEGFSGSLAAHAGELERRVVALQARADQVLGSSWQGITANELNATFGRWVDGPGVRGKHLLPCRPSPA